MLRALYNAARSISTLGTTSQVSKKEIRFFIKEMSNHVTEHGLRFHAGRSISRTPVEIPYIYFPFRKTAPGSEAQDSQRYKIAEKVCEILESKSFAVGIKGNTILIENHEKSLWKTKHQLVGLLDALDSELAEPPAPMCETSQINKEEMQLFIKEMANNLGELRSDFHAGRSIVRSSINNQFIIFPFIKPEPASDEENRKRYSIAEKICELLKSKNINAEINIMVEGIVFENDREGSWRTKQELARLLDALDPEPEKPNDIVKTVTNALLPKEYRSNQLKHLF